MPYPYDQGAPPGYGQPGLFGATLGGFGVGTGSMYGQQAYAGMGGGLAAMGAVGAMSTMPTALGAGVGIGSLFAPMLMPGFQSAGRLAAGHAGIMATGSMGSALGYGALKTLDMMDPFSHVMSFGAAGGRAGFGVGARLFGASGGLGAVSGAFNSAYASGGLAAGLRAGVGAGARFGGAAAMGGVGALGAAALPLAAGLAAYQGLEYSGQQMYRGVTDTLQGQALMNRLGPSIAPGQSMRGEGASTGVMMRDLAGDLGTGVEDIGRYAQELNSQRVFQSTRSAKEFRDKFKEVMGAVKEIAKIAQSSVDDAVKMFGDLRQQGFYTTADIKAQAASRQAREMTTGISTGVQSAIGSAGSSMARQYGMRGRFGAQLAESNVAGVAMGVRSGAMSEEEVQELGGVEAVGMRMAQQQMGFMRSARGRAMIAYAMGEGGAPDASRLNRMLRGTSMEDIVTGAAGRGLGVLRAAGGREARENFAPYAGMAMVQMAASQQRQLYGGVSRRGIIGMLGTMGVRQQEAELMLQQTMQMPEQLRQEQMAKEYDAERRRYDTLRDQQSLVSGAGRLIDREFGEPLRGIGRGVGQAVAGGYRRAMTSLTGGETYTGGDDALANRFRGRGGSLRLGMDTSENRNLFGLSRASDRLASQYGSMVMGRGELEDASGNYMSNEQLQREMDAGRIRELGRSMGGMGSQRYVRTADVQRADRAYREGRSADVSDSGVAQLRQFLSSRDEASGMQGTLAGRGVEGQIRQSKMRELTRTGGFLGFALGGLSELPGMRNLDVLENLDVSGTMGKLDQANREMVLAQEAGLIDRGTTLKQFMGRSVADRLKLRGQTEAALRKAGGEDARRQLEALGSLETGLLDTASLQSTRDSARSLLSTRFSGKFGRWGAWTGLRTGGSQAGLAEKLTQDGKARQAYDSYIAAVQGRDGRGSIRNAQALNDAEEELKKALGGEDSELFKAALDQKNQLMAMSDEERKAFKTSTQDILGQQAYAEQVFRDTDRLKKRVSKIDVYSIQNEELQNAVRQLGSVQGIDGRKAAMERLIGESIRSGGALSAEERDIISRVGGAGQGEKLGTLLETLRSGKGAEVKDGAGRQVFSAEALKDIQGKSGQEQAEAIVKALKDAGLMDTAAFGSSEGGKSIRGVQAEYVEANEQFVQSVHAFASALAAAGIKGVPDITGPANAVTGAGTEVTSGSNT